jgi:hypothetical protein
VLVRRNGQRGGHPSRENNAGRETFSGQYFEKFSGQALVIPAKAETQ